MTLRGQRFNIEDFDADDEPETSTPQAFNPFSFIGDVQERTSTAVASPPKPPSFGSSQSGFPVHRKREVQSRFKKSKQQSATPAATAQPPSETQSQPQDVFTFAGSQRDEDDFMTADKRRIDEENRERIAAMSPEEIEEERRELLASLDPSLIERLLKRATFESGGSDADFPGIEKKNEEAPLPEPKASKPRKSVKFAENEQEPEKEVKKEDVKSVDNADRTDTPVDGEEAKQTGNEAAAKVALPTDSSIHFPRPPQPPSLDPSDPNFLEDLHEKYFPDLPADPEKLEWMSSAPSDAYSAAQTSLDPKDIRFAFTGALIPPSLASEIPVTQGLHHHGNAPDAAGYTIPELAMLARSSVPAQRCVAFQTLGRILYRLGKGEFGNPGDGGQGTVGVEDTLGELARGLWDEVVKENVIEVCVAESEGRGVAGGRHMSARAYATEAVWLWQKGGGRRWKAG